VNVARRFLNTEFQYLPESKQYFSGIFTMNQTGEWRKLSATWRYDTKAIHLNIDGKTTRISLNASKE